MQIKGSLKTATPVIFIIAIALMASSIVSIYYQEQPQPLILASFSAITLGAIIWSTTRKAKTKNLQIQEGCLIVSIAWILACLLGAIPYFTLNNFNPNFSFSITQSIFESVSGLTTTGASIMTDIESLPRGILFWRSLSQWLGGMGIVVLAIAILPKIGVGGLQAFKMETPGPLKNDKLMPRISQSAKILYRVYLILTIVLFISLVSVEVGYFDAIIHTFSTIATGGFSNYNNSVAGLENPSAEYIITFFMWLSGVNFGLIYFTLWKRNPKLIIHNSEFKGYLLLYILGILSVITFLYETHFADLSFEETFRQAIFQVTSIMTTSGFSTVNYSNWPIFPITILVILMFIGGCAGSTTGSLKIIRHIISFKFIKWELLKIIKPNLVTSIKVGSRPIKHSIVQSVIVLILLFISLFAAGTVALSFFEIDLFTAASASIANLSGVGPALNQLGPAGNYASIPAGAQWICITLMFLGRLEIITVLVLFNPRIWFQK